MAKPKAMMWYPERWRADPHVDLMSSATRSGYREILDAMWLAGGSLPDDDRALFILSRMTPAEWRKGRDEIRARLKRRPDGTLTQEVAENEYQRTVELQEKRSKAGKAGANGRWQTHGKRIAFANADAMETETETETETEERTSLPLPPLQIEPVNRDPGYEPRAGFDRFRTLARRKSELAWKGEAPGMAWAEVVTSAAIERQVFEGFERWSESKRWADGVFSNWHNWLRNLDFTKTPEGSKPQLSVLGKVLKKAREGNGN